MHKSMMQTMSVEQYVLCEKIALAAGFDSVADWVDFIVSEKVGHTFLSQKR